MLIGCMVIPMGFRENLKSELTYQDMLVKELASQAGISKHTLDNYLNVREHIPTADVAVKIAKALGVSVEYLVTGDECGHDKTSLSAELRVLIQNFKQLNEADRKMVISIVQMFKQQRAKPPESP
ncbi:MAG: helix-turn-helix domain-containing protein [Spirochaetaceae bacterium]|jgi:transcriptional regulator with XRE-family HTH domain|nr:helix-turn-helix domain-containing protein [Spirochaetaceae bacterium]